MVQSAGVASSMFYPPQLNSGNIKTLHIIFLDDFREGGFQRQETVKTFKLENRIVKTSKLENTIEYTYGFRFR
jgi:hypothetical protein